MKTITIPGFITHTHYSWEAADEAKIEFRSSVEPLYDDSQYTVAICPHSITVQIPKHFNPTAQKIAALRGTMTKIQEAAYKECRNVEDEIAKLECLTYDPQHIDHMEDLTEAQVLDAADYHTGEDE